MQSLQRKKGGRQFNVNETSIHPGLICVVKSMNFKFNNAVSVTDHIQSISYNHNIYYVVYY